MKQNEAIKFLNDLIAQAEKLKNGSAYSTEHTRWRVNCGDILDDIFGRGSVYANSLNKLTYTHKGTKIASSWRSVESHMRASRHKGFLDDMDGAIGFLQAALDKVERKGINKVKSKHNLTCFLSYKFTEAGISYADIVKKFLELSNIKVVTGSEFEPQSVSNKIEGRLSISHFGIGIISSEKQSMWTRDEVVTLKAVGKNVIFMIEEGVEFEEGIFGNIEVIYFPEGTITQGFIKLLEGIKYINGQLVQD